MRNIASKISAGILLTLLLAGASVARSSEQFSAEQLSTEQAVAAPIPQSFPTVSLDARIEPLPQDSTGRLNPNCPATESGDVQSAPPDDRPKLNVIWDNGVIMESPDKTFRLHVGGRLEFDNTWYQQSQNLPFDLQDGADMRRARLRADGSIGKNVDFVTEVNFANIQDVTNEDTSTQIGSVGLTDFYATFKDLSIVGNVRVGHFSQPIGLEYSTSSNDWYYMERSPGNDAFLQPFNFVDGVMVFDSYFDDRITAALAFTRVGKQTVTPFAFGAGYGEYAVTGRLTFLPLYEDEGRRLLHLGLGYDYSGTDNNNFATANRPLVRAGAGSTEVPNVIQTGSYYTTDPVQLVDAEVAMVQGRLSMSAEYQLAHGTNVYEQLTNGVFSNPRGNPTYQACYVEGGFFLNADDHRNYDKKDGTWGRQGAASTAQGSSPWLFEHTPVQLVCRYSYLNLASGQPVLTPSSGAQAGWENDVTAGAVWYINPNVHFMLNYVFTELDYVNGASGHINGLGCRMHLDF